MWDIPLHDTGSDGLRNRQMAIVLRDVCQVIVCYNHGCTTKNPQLRAQSGMLLGSGYPGHPASHWPWLISQGVVAKNARAFWNVPGRLGDVARCCILPRWVHGNTIKRQHVSTGIGIHDNQPLDIWIEFDYAYGILGQMQMFLKLSHGREHMGSILFQDATWGSRKAQLCKPKLGAHVSSDPTDTV